MIFNTQTAPAPATHDQTPSRPLLQRKCSCGGSAGPSGECEECKKKRGTLQTKLAVGRAGDAFEQEADRAAESVMSGNAASPLSTLTAHANGQARDTGTAPPVVDEVLQSGGQPLDSGTRETMEQRFGHDFGRVRIHADAKAGESARAVHAHAYTVGDHVAFDAGLYSPSTHAGRTLIAHELAHVVQQSSGRSSSLQRDDAKPAARIDVAIVLGDEDISMTEARSYASTVLRVTSGEDAKKQLLALGKPIGTIYVVSHSNRSGEVEVISGIGTISHIKLSDFSKDLKGLPADKAPTDVDFRGCKLGEAPQEMETFRQNVGAKSARATNCWSIVATVTPLTVSGVPLTEESQIPKGQEAAVDAELKRQINGLKSSNGRSVKNCLIGLARGETADQNFAKLKRIYFQNKGNLTAGWASPALNNDWQEGSICVKDMTATTEPCKIVTTSAPPAPAGSGAKKAAMREESSDTKYAGDALAQPEGDRLA